VDTGCLLPREKGNKQEEIKSKLVFKIERSPPHFFNWERGLSLAIYLM